MIDEYLKRHDEIPHEVCAGLRTAGVQYLSIRRLPQTSTLVMIVDVSGDVDFSQAVGPGSAYRKDPVCEKWEVDMMTKYHCGWTELEEVHSSNREWNKSLGLPVSMIPQRKA